MAQLRYRFVKDYSSGHGTWKTGQIGEFEPDFAEWMNRDVPGCLELVEEKPKAKAKADDEDKDGERAPEKPPADRMQRAAEKRGG